MPKEIDVIVLSDRHLLVEDRHRIGLIYNRLSLDRLAKAPDGIDVIRLWHRDLQLVRAAIRHPRIQCVKRKQICECAPRD
jgi:hypothetical protein